MLVYNSYPRYTAEVAVFYEEAKPKKKSKFARIFKAICRPRKYYTYTLEEECYNPYTDTTTYTYYLD